MWFCRIFPAELFDGLSVFSQSCGFSRFFSRHDCFQYILSKSGNGVFEKGEGICAGVWLSYSTGVKCPYPALNMVCDRQDVYRHYREAVLRYRQSVRSRGYRIPCNGGFALYWGWHRTYLYQWWSNVVAVSNIEEVVYGYRKASPVNEPVRTGGICRECIKVRMMLNIWWSPRHSNRTGEPVSGRVWLISII